MKRIILVRHGETSENVAGLYAGSIEAQLTEKGLRQIELLAHRLRIERFDAAFCSDLTRAVQTADAILRFHSAVKLWSTELIREKSGGVFEGRPYDEYVQARAVAEVGEEEFRPDGGESFSDVYERSRTFFQQHIEPLPPGSSSLVVAHGGFNRCFLSYLLGQPVRRALAKDQGNTCVNVITVGKDQVDAPLINCMAHLSGETVSC